jgi:hypothetical protein
VRLVTGRVKVYATPGGRKRLEIGFHSSTSTSAVAANETETETEAWMTTVYP